MVTLDHEVKVDQPPNFTEGVLDALSGRHLLPVLFGGALEHSTYQVHYAVSLSPTGPWRYGGPILTERQEI
jgi:hypothetical protein